MPFGSHKMMTKDRYLVRLLFLVVADASLFNSNKIRKKTGSSTQMMLRGLDDFARMAAVICFARVRR